MRGFEMSDFEKWFKKYGFLSCDSCKENSLEAWDFQQSKIDKLQAELTLAREENKTLIDQHKVMIDSYNYLCDDLYNGEPVEIDWVRQAIDSAARDILVKALNVKAAELKKEIDKLQVENKLLKEFASDAMPITIRLIEK